MRRAFPISLLAVLAFVFFRPAFAQVAISVTFAPPALPVYEQPPCPGDGFFWTPGFWAWDADDYDYYWVPGTWVMPPEPGLLWTPAWWGWENGAFLFHDGFWASEVGFYGGINYGFGYFGEGFYGGRWDHDRFYYNRAVWNVNHTKIRNVYEDRTVVVNRNENRVSFNGGQGGTTARPTARDQQAANARHFPPARPQEENRQQARSNPMLRASTNHGKPPVAATTHPGGFKGKGVVAARAAGGPYQQPETRAGHQPGGENRRAGDNAMAAGAAAHARDVHPHTTLDQTAGGTKAHEKYQKQEQKLIEKQNKEHAKLEKQQAKEDHKAAKVANQQKQQQIEQRHQQQTKQMEQRHAEQQERIEPRQNPHQPR